jgi:hypothetical protein
VTPAGSFRGPRPGTGWPSGASQPGEQGSDSRSLRRARPFDRSRPPVSRTCSSGREPRVRVCQWPLSSFTRVFGPVRRTLPNVTAPRYRSRCRISRPPMIDHRFTGTGPRSARSFSTSASLRRCGPATPSALGYRAMRESPHPRPPCGRSAAQSRLAPRRLRCAASFAPGSRSFL